MGVAELLLGTMQGLSVMTLGVGIAERDRAQGFRGSGALHALGVKGQGQNVESEAKGRTRHTKQRANADLSSAVGKTVENVLSGFFTSLYKVVHAGKLQCSGAMIHACASPHAVLSIYIDTKVPNHTHTHVCTFTQLQLFLQKQP